ncbi:hypothetical protein [Thermodesulfobacterium hydrogeniphilum]|uniref:hypothetical protein n=1 Tax=Thermodesulfobacterium hydrogeniphilum TaxID=161156 RepID=UPI00056DC0F5|nr:hypothetical protein [Thermodesulfobacterium hydrogeniphilum]
MSENYSLKKELIKIELALKQNKLDQALELYENINKNWEKYENNLKIEEINNLIRLLDYIEKLLKNKYKKSLENQKFLNLRKAYTRF